MLSSHQQFEESSSDEENLAALKAVAVSFEDLTRKSGQDSSKNSRGGQKRCDPSVNNAEEGEESLPEGFQRTLWEALEQRLDSELRKKSSNAAVHAMSQEPAAATKDDEDSARIQLFKRTPRTAKFMAQQVNRKLAIQGTLETNGPINIGRSRPHVDEDEAELLLKVESVAVDGEFILKHAAKAALAAQKHTVSPESSDSGLDDRAPVGTVTRVLRAFRAVSTPAAASKKKDKKKHKTTEDPGKYAGGQCDTDPTSKGSQQQSDQGAHNSSAAGFKDGSGTRRSVAEEVALSEEERRARKKAKKLRQKEQRKDDAEHAAKEKAKREKKKARGGGR